ncbi:hypothetical protein [Mumia zhuanghuii]|uniref:hypothetical protein n=1 Tax=Mumia zhuanghuii TaxID=2585211 RepID=UPI003637FAAF
MKSPWGMPAQTQRMFALSAAAVLAVAALEREAAVAWPVLLLALAACGVRWARVVFAFGAAFWAVLAVWGWGYVVVHGGSIAADEARMLAAVTMYAVALLGVTSPVVKQWVGAQPSLRTISQSAPG